MNQAEPVDATRAMRPKLRRLIERNLAIPSVDQMFSDADDLFVGGYVNSLFAMKLLVFVESEFGIEIDVEDMDLANFRSIDRIVELVERKQSATQPQGVD
ncbi:acyl carrier protein [Bradyrhizobium ontarionense]|uniref:Acyl carrier protein n=1 Tax=Bradyrhizobium ontarionense TaxID=2898149 RepID=A0ABY3RBE9_9BRAD|nr:acyl carrier protein [Bradyrhizobium sp. A19]UFZ04098.1 acyl carrier protein [Bradyrhizobium sp. A19]